MICRNFNKERRGIKYADVDLPYENQEQADKELSSYLNYMRAMLSHDEPFTLYFGPNIFRGSEIIGFRIMRATEDGEAIEETEHRVIGFDTKM